MYDGIDQLLRYLISDTPENCNTLHLVAADFLCIHFYHHPSAGFLAFAGKHRLVSDRRFVDVFFAQREVVFNNRKTFGLVSTFEISKSTKSPRLVRGLLYMGNFD